MWLAATERAAQIWIINYRDRGVEMKKKNHVGCGFGSYEEIL